MSGWPSIPLSKIVAERCGSVDPAKYPDEIFDLYSIPAFDRGTPEVSTGNKIGSAKQLVQPGDVLLSKIVPHIRRSWVVGENQGRRLIASGEWIVFRSESIHPPYLRHVLVGDQFHAKFMQTVSGVGGSLLRARPAHVARIPIPLPPFAEQRRLAAILDKADAIRRKRVEALCLADDFLQSVFHDLVGPGAMGYERWQEMTISELAATHRGAIRTGPFGSNLRHSEFVDEGIAVLGIDNAVNNRFSWSQRRFVTKEKYEELQQYTVFPGDVIITIMGTTGRTAVVPKDIPTAISTKHLATITLNKKLVHPQFVAFSVRQNPDVLHQIAMASKGAIMDGLNLTIIKNLRLRVPPLDVQDQFEAIVTCAEKARSLSLSLQDEADKLFGSLVQRAFRGDL